MTDKQFVTALASMSNEDLESFCKKVLERSITINVSPENYVSLTLILLKYFNSTQTKE